MKTSKSFTLLWVMSALFIASMQAQDQTTPPSEGRRGKGGQTQGRGQMLSPEARVAELDKAVSLTEEQKTKIKELYTKSQEEMRSAMRGGGGGDRDAARQKMVEAMRKTRDQVRALLTDEQKKKFDEMPQRGAGDQGGRRGKRDAKTK
jgi:periplasmic protein CpxP/Spy